MSIVIQCWFQATATPSGNASFSLLPMSPWVTPTAMGAINATCGGLEEAPGATEFGLA